MSTYKGNIKQIKGPFSQAFSLSVFAVSVETAIEKAYPLFQVMPILCHHTISNHLLLSDETLKFISLETFEPYRTFDQVFWMGSKVTQYPNVVIDSKHAPLLSPSVHLFWFGNSMHSNSSTTACTEVSRAHQH